MSVAAQESSKLYALIQTAVDAEIQQVGFMPDATSYGMKPSQNDNAHPSNPPGGGNGHPSNSANGNGNGETWNCTDGQKSFLLRIISDNKLDKNNVEALAQQLFGVGVKELNKMQMSQLIEDLLEKHGKQGNHRRRWSRPQTTRA